MDVLKAWKIIENIVYWENEYELNDEKREAMKTISEKIKADEWISVKEDLPLEVMNLNTKDFEEVLCSTVWGDVRTYKFGTPMGQGMPHFWNSGSKMDGFVTHWKRLPEPYKESEDGE